MKSTFAFAIIAVLAGSFQAASAADISGKVKLKGTPKPEIPIQLDATCGKLRTQPITTRHFVVGQDNGLGNVFVYVKSGAQKTPSAGEPATLDQVNCMYEPYVFGVVAGQKFKVKNSDPELHNVHATPKLNKEFNFAQPTKGLVSEKSFDQPEVLVRIKCDVHPWMFAYIGVCEHPYFAVTDNEGNFKISGVPDGKYTLVAYHLKTHGANPGLTQSVDLKGTAKQDFTVELPVAP